MRFQNFDQFLKQRDEIKDQTYHCDILEHEGKREDPATFQRTINLKAKYQDGFRCLRSIIKNQKTLENIFKILKKRVSQGTIEGCTYKKEGKIKK